MVAICFACIGIGFIIGLFFSLLYANFDSGWKRAISSILTVVTSGTGLGLGFEKLGITGATNICISIGVICFSFIVSFIICMIVLCIIIRDKDNKDKKDIIRIRDIILGQKKYIQEYYNSRAKEIDNRLNIPKLEEREHLIKQNEERILHEKIILDREREEFAKEMNEKLKIKLPENKDLYVSNEFLDMFPSFVENLSSFIERINTETEMFINEHDSISKEDLNIFLFLISVIISEQLFGRSSKDVRVHFRYYNEKNNDYRKLVSVIGEKDYKRDMKNIPYNEKNMIVKSFECKRALIKSHNLEYDFEGNNTTIWENYMTGAFYNITRNGKPCLSFGISVKNSGRFKHIFNFLNYCKFESYLQEVIEQIDEKYNIESVLYENT